MQAGHLKDAPVLPPLRLILTAALLAPLGAALPAQAQPAPVLTTTPEPATVAETLLLHGSVTTPQRATLAAPVAGLVAEVLVEAGDRVEAGAPLLQLDRELARLALQAQSAALDEARAELAEARRLVAEARKVAGRGDLPQTETQARQAGAELAAARVARLSALQAEQAERLSRHTLRAPFAGVVRRREVAPGAWLAVGEAALELVGLAPRRIEVQVPQRRLAALNGVREAQVTIPALSLELTAPVRAQLPIVDANSRSFLLQLDAEAAPAAVTPGLSATVRLELPGTQNALRIPFDAVQRFPDGSHIVWLVDEQQQAQRRPVTLGARSGDAVLVLDGLQASDRVVVRGNEALQPGREVQARAWSDAGNGTGP